MTDNHLHQGETAEYWANQFYKLAAETQENFAHIYAKQQREQEDRTTVFAAVSPGRHITQMNDEDFYDNYEDAAYMADFFDNAQILTRTVTPWQPIEATTQGTDQALAEDG